MQCIFMLAMPFKNTPPSIASSPVVCTHSITDVKEMITAQALRGKHCFRLTGLKRMKHIKQRHIDT